MTRWVTDKGSEMCEFCQQDYYEEAGSYCISCDRPLCAGCTVSVFTPRQVLCPECAKDKQQEKS